MEMSQNNKTSRTQREIDENLKRAYDDVIKQKVPDRFTDLLAQLKKAETTDKERQSKGDNVEQ